jgi:hypothetical protein
LLLQCNLHPLLLLLQPVGAQRRRRLNPPHMYPYCPSWRRGTPLRTRGKCVPQPRTAGKADQLLRVVDKYVTPTCFSSMWRPQRWREMWDGQRVFGSCTRGS